MLFFSSDNSHHCKLEFEVSEFFMFGSPLSLVLAYRKISSTGDKTSNISRPCVHQVYNLFHPSDPVAARLEPLISARFSLLPPVNVARYQKYPLGNGQPYHLRELICRQNYAFSTDPCFFSSFLLYDSHRFIRYIFLVKQINSIASSNATQ